jgi:hypothetical protein
MAENFMRHPAVDKDEKTVWYDIKDGTISPGVIGVVWLDMRSQEF